METRTLLARIAEVLTQEGVDPADCDDNREDHVRRRADGSCFNPTPEEIRAATLSIQAEWSEEELLKRAGAFQKSRRWRVPRVRAAVAHDDDS